MKAWIITSILIDFFRDKGGVLNIRFSDVNDTVELMTEQYDLVIGKSKPEGLPEAANVDVEAEILPQIMQALKDTGWSLLLLKVR